VTAEIARPAITTVRARPVRAYIALALGVTAISFTAIFTKWAAMPGVPAATCRMTTAAVALTIALVVRTRGRPVLSRARVGWGLLGGLVFALNLALLYTALETTAAATATLLDNTAPIWVGLGAMAFFGERLSARYWAGLGLALAGAAVVTGLRAGEGAMLQPGAALAFIGAIFYAGYLLVTQRARQQLDSLTYLWLMAVVAAIALAAASLLLGMPLTGYASRSYLSLMAVGLVSQTAGWLLINYALGHVPASAAVVVLLAQPVITGLLSIPLLGEALAARQIAGGALLLAGIYLCLRGGAARAVEEAGP